MTSEVTRRVGSSVSHNTRVPLPSPPTPVRVRHNHRSLAACLGILVLLGAGCTLPQWWSPSPPVPATIQVQARLLELARVERDQGHYEAAVGLLRRLITTYPDSPYLMEAHWWLARSCEQAGDLNSALAEYRVLAEGGPQTRYGAEAQSRISSLEPLVRGVATRPGPLAVIAVSPQALRAIPEPDQWMAALVASGATTLLLDVGTPRGHEPAGVFFQTGSAVMLHDAFGQLVPVAHRHGLAVFAAVTLRCMDWVAPHLGWHDLTYDRTRLQLRPSVYLDIFHPAFQDYLAGFLSDLAETGVDGVLFRNDAPLGLADGFSPYGTRVFEREFDIKLVPGSLFSSSGAAPLRAPASESPASSRALSYSPEFWRWAGWKARASLGVTDRLIRVLRARAARLQFVLEVHQQTVTNPLEGLVQYGEDLLEAKRFRFDYFFTVLGLSPDPSSMRSAGQNGHKLVISRMVELIGSPERIWVTAPVPEEDLQGLGDRLHLAVDRVRLGQGIGLVYVTTSRSVP